MTRTLAEVAAAATTGVGGATTAEQGRALEDLVCDLFNLVPGVEITHRNPLNAFHTEEIDVAIWNEQHADGFFFLPYVVLIECKNWTAAVSSIEIAWFHTKLRNRGLSHGILIAANGITGDAEAVTSANFEVATALAEHRFLIVLTLDEIAKLSDIAGLIRLVKVRLCDLAVRGSFV
jgi:hypothetical protein